MHTNLAIIGAGALGGEFAAVLKNSIHYFSNQFLGYFDDRVEACKLIKDLPDFCLFNSILSSTNKCNLLKQTAKRPLEAFFAV